MTGIEWVDNISFDLIRWMIRTEVNVMIKIVDKMFIISLLK